MKRIEYNVIIDGRVFVGDISFFRDASFDEAMGAVEEDIRREMLREKRRREQQGGDAHA
ncbi:hypothetical protein [Halopseudomonas xiamenensis]|uniref:hypothetical protein n=1 Tax=Halopseudomonas xiamenensis TaxID=157792 RepID=UPI0016262212|nr:hypothetical protein [Halopseudomonas xiamenensis]